MISFVSPLDMDAAQLSAHMKEHHPGVMPQTREEHAEHHHKNFAARTHNHLPSDAHRKAAHAGDITRTDAIEPVAIGTIYVSGYDEHGAEDWE